MLLRGSSPIVKVTYSSLSEMLAQFCKVISPMFNVWLRTVSEKYKIS